MKVKGNQSFLFNMSLKRILNMAMLVMLVALMSGTLSSCDSSKKMAKKDLEMRLEVAKQRLQAILDDPLISINDMENELRDIKSQNFDSPYIKKLQPKVAEVKDLIRQVENKLEKAKKQQIEEIKIRLNGLLYNQTMSADDLERELNEIKALNIKDAEVQRLIAQIEAKIKEMREGMGSISTNSDLDRYFDEVISLSKSGNIERTNMKIKDILKFFTNSEAPLLIIVYRENGVPIDYDKPTTIGAYLNYLKDQKVNHNTTYSIERDAAGKIKLVELLKNNR
jgi:small-conductance mechanosensitive channel